MHAASERQRGRIAANFYSVDMPQLVELWADQIVAELRRGKGEHGWNPFRLASLLDVVVDTREPLWIDSRVLTVRKTFCRCDVVASVNGSTS